VKLRAIHAAGAAAAVMVAWMLPFVLAAEEQSAATISEHDNVVKSMTSARSLYVLKCSGCHRIDGAGAPAAGIPPFPGFIAPLARQPEGRVYIAHVPGIAASRLSDAQLVDVLNYVIEEWSGDEGAATPRFTVDEFSVLRAVPVSNVVELRRDVVAQLKEAGEPVADYPWP
jgi:mono/diheme cytochrome c family protein